jgi:hypothetical protein
MKTTQRNRRRLPLAVIASAVVLLPLSAFADLAKGDLVGKTEVEVRTSLAGQGYKVGDVEKEDGQIQAEVVQKGEELEIHVDPATGRIVAIRSDDHRDRNDDGDSSHDRKDGHADDKMNTGKGTN